MPDLYVFYEIFRTVLYKIFRKEILRTFRPCMSRTANGYKASFVSSHTH